MLKNNIIEDYQDVIKDKSWTDTFWLEEVNTIDDSNLYFSTKGHQLEKEIFEWNPEAYNEKDFTRDESTKTLSYVYDLWIYKSAMVHLQKIDNNIKLTLNVHNQYFFWSSEITKNFNIKDISKISEFIYDTFKKWIDLKTYWERVVQKNYKPNDYSLWKIKEKADKSIQILQKHIK